MLRPFGEVYEEEKQLEIHGTGSLERGAPRPVHVVKTHPRHRHSARPMRVVNQRAFDNFLARAAKFAKERARHEAEESVEDERRRARYGEETHEDSGGQHSSSGPRGGFVPKFDPKKDYYRILGIVRTASRQEIKSCYKKLALRHHPDKQASRSPEERAESDTLFKDIREAFEILSDAGQRRAYDDRLLLKPHWAGGAQHQQQCETAYATVWVSLESLCNGGSTTFTRQRHFINSGVLMVEEKTHVLVVKKGSRDGSIITLERAGDHTDLKKLPGNLSIVLRQEPHACFTPVGEKDLMLKAQAPQLGDLYFCEDVQCPSGRRIMVVGDIIQQLLDWWLRDGATGEVLPFVCSARISGEGMPDSKAPYLAPRGDIIVQAEFPPFCSQPGSLNFCSCIPTLRPLLNVTSTTDIPRAVIASLDWLRAYSAGQSNSNSSSSTTTTGSTCSCLCLSLHEPTAPVSPTAADLMAIVSAMSVCSAGLQLRWQVVNASLTGSDQTNGRMDVNEASLLDDEWLAVQDADLLVVDAVGGYGPESALNSPLVEDIDETATCQSERCDASVTASGSPSCIASWAGDISPRQMGGMAAGCNPQDELESSLGWLLRDLYFQGAQIIWLGDRLAPQRLFP